MMGRVLTMWKDGFDLPQLDKRIKIYLTSLKTQPPTLTATDLEISRNALVFSNELLIVWSINHCTEDGRSRKHY